MQKRKYRRPPIVEVICEFRFKSSSEWDATVPGRIYERLKEEFPVRRPVRHVGFTVQPTTEASSFQVQYEEGMRFLREDERAFVQVHPHRISIHHLAPYPHWEGFKPLIVKGYKAYLDIVRRPALQRIGLRYINRIVLPQGHKSPSDYFNLYPHIAESLLRNYAAFALYLLLPFEDGRDAMHLRLGSEEFGNDGLTAILLDLDYFLAKPEDITSDTALEWVEQAHWHVVDVFEGVITDKLRVLLGEES